MRAVVQRVIKAKVIVSGEIISEIKRGIVAFIAVAPSDDEQTIKWFANKLMNLRIFPDSQEKMNISILDIQGELLVISNFTVYGNTKKGFRPNFMESAPQEYANNIYTRFIDYLKSIYKIKVETGIFGADMEVHLVNDGPVNIIIDSLD